jgi:hypothetical protein
VTTLDDLLSPIGNTPDLRDGNCIGDWVTFDNTDDPLVVDEALEHPPACTHLPDRDRATLLIDRLPFGQLALYHLAVIDARARIFADALAIPANWYACTKRPSGCAAAMTCTNADARPVDHLDKPLTRGYTKVQHKIRHLGTGRTLLKSGFGYNVTENRRKRCRKGFASCRNGVCWRCTRPKTIAEKKLQPGKGEQ